MPSPGAASIAATIGSQTYTVEGGYPAQFVNPSTFVTTLADAINTGWTCASPTTPSTMGSAFNSAFSKFLGDGLLFLDCIASGIDDEVAAWVASWNTTSSTHTYVVSASSIVSRILGCTPITSNGIQALANACANAFMSGFGQETG